MSKTQPFSIENEINKVLEGIKESLQPSPLDENIKLRIELNSAIEVIKYYASERSWLYNSKEQDYSITKKSDISVCQGSQDWTGGAMARNWLMEKNNNKRNN